MPRERLRVELDILLSQIPLAPAAGWFDDLGLARLSFGEREVALDPMAPALPSAEKLDRWRDARSDGAVLPSLQPASPESPLALHWTLLAGRFASTRPKHLLACTQSPGEA